ncbi:AMP-binding protein [Sphingomonas sp. CROZ-RG-20F-R02-07]|uniref:AMP-binding protein n=1 Tax=Sphingomonas sp. CROZ-RG-20F-R02-07 TaxID=2914832 RepID=UPI001F55DBDB|nr:AMP-binding protein [Sphingomonas sp. CROZ-RG-20F-R02-07]
MSGQALAALTRYPERVAFAWPGGRLRYRGALDLIGRMQAVFAGMALPPGAMIAILSDNSAESWCAGIAAQASGLGITWLHPKASLDDQLFQVADSGAACLLVDATGHADRGEALHGLLPRSVALLSLGRSGFAPDLVEQAAAQGAATVRDLADPDAVATIHYTGGTTGRSKGAVRSHRAAAAFAVHAPLADWEWPATPQYLGIAPNSHAAGTFIIPTLRLGGTAHLLRGFDIDEVLNLIPREGINTSFLVPSMIYALLDAPGLDAADLSRLELLHYGAAPMSPARLAEGLERIGPVFSQGYGQTECLPIAILGRADHDLARPELFSSCGFPASSCEVRLLDEQGNEAGPDETGEICVRSPAALDWYHNLPEQTAETLGDGWLRTGDIARRDDRGFLFIVDRKKDLIISGGFNVYSREVEDALAAHHAVAVSAVIGLPDPRWGEAVTAFVVLRPGEDCTSDALIRHVKERKGSIQAPKRVEIVRELPMTAIGKIDKKLLRRLHEQAALAETEVTHG